MLFELKSFNKYYFNILGDDQKERERDLVNAEMIPTQATTLSFWDKLLELQYKMLFSHQEPLQSHMYSSEPLEWPFMSRTIAYWVSPNSNVSLKLFAYLIKSINSHPSFRHKFTSSGT